MDDVQIGKPQNSRERECRGDIRLFPFHIMAGSICCTVAASSILAFEPSEHMMSQSLSVCPLEA